MGELILPGEPGFHARGEIGHPADRFRPGMRVAIAATKVPLKEQGIDYPYGWVKKIEWSNRLGDIGVWVTLLDGRVFCFLATVLEPVD